MMNNKLTLRNQSISPKGQTLIYYLYAKPIYGINTFLLLFIVICLSLS